MYQHIYIIHSKELSNVAFAIDKHITANSIYETAVGLNANDLHKLAALSLTEYFYIIQSDTEIHFPHFDFSFKPPIWDKDYVHIWNNDTRVRLYNRENVLNNPALYTDEELAKGNVQLKIINDRIFEYPKIDIVFLSYDEENADTNFANIKSKFSNVKRSHGVKGILEAHKAAAKIASTDMFYVVDADAELEDTFDFSYRPNGYDMSSVHVWYSRNPVNDLIYGYGGVKLFPRQLLLDYTGTPVDFTTSVAKDFKIMNEISNTTKFNTDPFSAWRSGFRECTKLASKLIHNGNNTESEERLNVWCTKGVDREFGEFAIMGAKDGRDFGIAHNDQPDMLGLINDYFWLQKRFSD